MCNGHMPGAGVLNAWNVQLGAILKVEHTLHCIINSKYVIIIIIPLKVLLGPLKGLIVLHIMLTDRHMKQLLNHFVHVHTGQPPYFCPLMHVYTWV